MSDRAGWRAKWSWPDKARAVGPSPACVPRKARVNARGFAGRIGAGDRLTKGSLLTLNPAIHAGLREGDNVMTTLA